MHRRRYLSLLAAGPLAGCQTTPQGTTSTPTDGSAPTVPVGQSLTTDGGYEVTVSAPAVERFVVTRDLGSSVHTDVAGVADAQFLVVTVDAVATESAGTVTPADVAGSLRPETDGAVSADRPPYRVVDATDRLALQFPIADVDQAAVVWMHRGDVAGRWTLDTDTRATLGRAPAFEVRSFNAPDSVERGSAFEVAVTVVNTGDRDGTFVAEFGDERLVSDVGEVTVDVAADAEHTRALTYDPPDWEEVDDIELQLDWAISQVERTVRVE